MSRTKELSPTVLYEQVCSDAHRLGSLGLKPPVGPVLVALNNEVLALVRLFFARHQTLLLGPALRLL